jgi:signal transduction histidine kinase/CheY-like chemotaxis protein
MPTAGPTSRRTIRRCGLRAARGERIERERLVYLRGGPGGAERIVLEVDAMPIRSADGRLAGAVTVFEDAGLREQAERELQRRVADAVAELEIAQDALRQSQKLESMGQLTGGVAHDFNNLLTPIVGALDMLQRKGLGGNREQRLIAGAAQSAERAKMLVQRLLAFARRQPLQPIAVDIAKLVAGMAELIGSTSGPQIKVVVEVGDVLPTAKADPNQLEMALLNLSVNARDAMPEGGTLRITADEALIGRDHPTQLRPGPYVRLSVADTGVGMDEATLARAIEPFFSTKGVGKGTGLGLSMVHGLASQLGGALTIQSRRGVGTNVELWLPVISASPETAGAVAEAVHSIAAAGTALLVDDEELVRLSTADMLSDLGYAVTEAGSAEAALALIRGGLSPDLLVTDHLMPGMNGTELAQIVRSERPGVQILLVSGYAESEGVSPDLPRLTKPFRNEELAASIAALAPPPNGPD